MAIGVLKGIMAKGSKIKLGDKEYTIGKDLKALIQVGKTRGYEAVVEGYPISKIRRIKDKPIGWRLYPVEHGLAAKGIKTGRKKYISPFKDKPFRKWLREKKNIDDRVLLTLGTKGTITSYRKEYEKKGINDST